MKQGPALTASSFASISPICRMMTVILRSSRDRLRALPSRLRCACRPLSAPSTSSLYKWITWGDCLARSQASGRGLGRITVPQTDKRRGPLDVEFGARVLCDRTWSNDRGGKHSGQVPVEVWPVLQEARAQGRCRVTARARLLEVVCA